MSSRQKIWAGILPDFPKTARTVSPAFEADGWVERQVAEAEAAMQVAGRAQPERDDEAFFGGLMSALMSGTKKPLHVIDFGGSLALSLLFLRRHAVAIDSLRWTVVESKPLVSAGNAFAQRAGLENLRFVSDITDAGPCDVFYARNSFHYIRNWRGFVKNLAKRGTGLVYIRGLTAGGIPTFCTMQNYYGDAIPVWFFNEEEVISEFGKSDFRLVSRRLVKQRYFGRIQSLPMDNFPTSHRLKAKVDLVFSLER